MLGREKNKRVVAFRWWRTRAQIKSNRKKKERSYSWRWQAWLDGRVTPSFCRRGRRFVWQAGGDSRPDLTKTTSSSSAAVPAATWPPSKPRSSVWKPLASKSVALSAVPASTSDASLPRFIFFFKPLFCLCVAFGIHFLVRLNLVLFLVLIFF